MTDNKDLNDKIYQLNHVVIPESHAKLFLYLSDVHHEIFYFKKREALADYSIDCFFRHHCE